MREEKREGKEGRREGKKPHVPPCLTPGGSLFAHAPRGGGRASRRRSCNLRFSRAGAGSLLTGGGKSQGSGEGTWIPSREAGNPLSGRGTWIRSWEAGNPLREGGTWIPSREAGNPLRGGAGDMDPPTGGGKCLQGSGGHGSPQGRREMPSGKGGQRLSEFMAIVGFLKLIFKNTYLFIYTLKFVLLLPARRQQLLLCKALPPTSNLKL